jgi:FkbM family methyltransferase
VDVGANRGVYSWFFSRLVEKTVAYEPIESMADFLQRARLPGVEVRCKAVADKAERRTFSVPIDPAGRRQFNGGQFGDFESSADTFEVDTVRLDDEDLGDVGFLKVDVEGHEGAVIEGALELLKRCEPIVMLEILSLDKPMEHPLVVRMKALGYQPYFYDKESKSLLPLHRAKMDLLGRNFIFFPEAK